MKPGGGKGYHYDKRRKKWRATRMVDRRPIQLGMFDTEEEAKAFVAEYRANIDYLGKGKAAVARISAGVGTLYTTAAHPKRIYHGRTRKVVR